jgi:hypothetical protein
MQTQYGKDSKFSPKLIIIYDNGGTFDNPDDDTYLARGYYLGSGDKNEVGTLKIECLLTGEIQDWDYNPENIQLAYEVINPDNVEQQAFIHQMNNLSNDKLFTEKEKKEIFLSHFPVITYRRAKVAKLLNIPIKEWEKYIEYAAADESEVNIRKLIKGGGPRQVHKGDAEWTPSRFCKDEEAYKIKEKVIKKYKALIDKKFKDKLTEIDELIEKETEEDLKNEYTSLRKKLIIDVDLFIKENLNSKCSIWEIKYTVTSQWPTLLNPCPLF